MRTAPKKCSRRMLMTAPHFAAQAMPLFDLISSTLGIAWLPLVLALWPFNFPALPLLSTTKSCPHHHTPCRAPPLPRSTATQDG